VPARHCEEQHDEAIHSFLVRQDCNCFGSITAVSGILDRPPSRSGMTAESKRACTFSRRHAPEVFGNFAALALKRAQGKPGARCTRGLVCKVHRRKRTRAYRFSGGNPAFPAQWFTTYFVLSSVTGLFCHRRFHGSPQKLSASIGAPGPHDFAVRIELRSSVAAFASTASHRTFVTIASRPSSGETGRADSADLPDGLSGIFFARGLDRANHVDATGEFSPDAHAFVTPAEAA
jgi:hypothetical protein